MKPTEHGTGGLTYYVYGSGLIPVPHARVNEIPGIRMAFHEEENRRAMMLAWSRKLA